MLQKSAVIFSIVLIVILSYFFYERKKSRERSFLDLKEKFSNQYDTIDVNGFMMKYKGEAFPYYNDSISVIRLFGKPNYVVNSSGRFMFFIPGDYMYSFKSGFNNQYSPVELVISYEGNDWFIFLPQGQIQLDKNFSLKKCMNIFLKSYANKVDDPITKWREKTKIRLCVKPNKYDLQMVELNFKNDALYSVSLK